jgi:hypothetical protein
VIHFSNVAFVKKNFNVKIGLWNIYNHACLGSLCRNVFHSSQNVFWSTTERGRGGFGCERRRYLWTLLFNAPFGRCKETRCILYLDVTHQLLVCAEDIHILEENVNTLYERIAHTPWNAVQIICVVVSTVRTKPCYKFEWYSNSTEVAYAVLRNVGVFTYMGTTVINQNCIQEGIKEWSNVWNACQHWIQELLSSCLISQYARIKIPETILLHFCIVRKFGLSY